MLNLLQFVIEEFLPWKGREGDREKGEDGQIVRRRGK